MSDCALHNKLQLQIDNKVLLRTVLHYFICTRVHMFILCFTIWHIQETEIVYEQGLAEES